MSRRVAVVLVILAFLALAHGGFVVPWALEAPESELDLPDTAQHAAAQELDSWIRAHQPGSRTDDDLFYRLVTVYMAPSPAPALAEPTGAAANAPASLQGSVLASRPSERVVLIQVSQPVWAGQMLRVHRDGPTVAFVRVLGQPANSWLVGNEPANSWVVGNVITSAAPVRVGDVVSVEPLGD